MANPFYVPPPDVSNVLQNLMQGHKFTSGIRQDNQNAAVNQEAARLMQAGDHRGALAALMGAGNYAGAAVAGNFGNNERDHNFQREKFDESKRQFGVGVEGGRVPQGFERNPNGQGYRPIPGGPQDPAYINETRKGPQMTVGDISKLTEEGGKLANLTGFVNTFKDEYSGAIGQGLDNTLTRNTPDWLTGDKPKEIASWWQGYDAYKNVVRNDLFGSALTPSEQAEWLKSDIHPGMPAKLVKENLARQKAIVDRAVQKKASAIIEAGYDPKVVSKAYGIPFEGKQRGAASPVTTAPPAGAIKALQDNPKLRAAFDAKYGPGSAAQVLGQ